MTELPVIPAFGGNKLAIVLQGSNFYTPYSAVTIRSIIENSSSDHYYDIILKTLDMSEENAAVICKLAEGKDNVSVRVINVKNCYDRYLNKEHISGDKRFSGMSVMKILLPELLENYDRAIHVDSDMLVLGDIAGVFDLDLDEYYAAAVQDILAEFMYNDDGYVKKAIDTFLEIDSPRDYHNAAFMMFNLKKIREDFTIDQFVDFILDNKCELFEQDAFNHFFKGKTLELGYEWNFPIDTRRIIENGNKKNPSPLYEKYMAVKPYRKVIHYATAVKPWDSALCPESVKWWDVAARSPLYNIIVDRHNNLETGSRNSNRMFFVCETVFQLINILNIKYHIYPDVKADIGLVSTTDFSRYVKPLQDSGLFENVYMSGYRVQTDMAIFKDNAPNRDLLKNPDSYEHAFPLTEKYTDYFMSVSASPFQKLTYYQIVRKGIVPRVHIFEDGSDTYITNIHSTLCGDMFDHGVFKKDQQMLNNINELLFYEPVLYSGRDPFTLSVLPKIHENDTEFTDLLYSVFGKCEMPKEKYIYFNECFSTDKIPTNDIQLLDLIGDVVGKDNVTVKLHPRAERGEQLYMLHGYSIFAESTVPWEMFVLSARMKDKVLVSVSSNTLINPYIVFNKPVYAIYLKDVMKLSQRAHVRNPSYRIFFNKTMHLLNDPEKRVFCPTSLDQLYADIEFLEGTL